jgi:hypothetical protein
MRTGFRGLIDIWIPGGKGSGLLSCTSLKLRGKLLSACGLVGHTPSLHALFDSMEENLDMPCRATERSTEEKCCLSEWGPGPHNDTCLIRFQWLRSRSGASLLHGGRTSTTASSC